jgi:serine/threonine-protein kinase HipA
MRQANIYMHDDLAGRLQQDESGFTFIYNEAYLKSTHAQAISLNLPLQETPYKDNTMFPFFDGLIPEGWLLTIAEKNWKITARDRMGLLMACCKDCIGAVSVLPIKNDEL